MSSGTNSSHTARLGLIALLCLLLCGCGGGSGPASTGAGRAEFTVVWPEVSRLIPLASNSIVVSLSRGGTTLFTRILVRPQNRLTFDELAPGDYLVTATAFPSTDGSGVAQARGQAPLTIAPDAVSAITLVMASTIDHLEVTPPAPSVFAGSTVPLTMTARDAAGNVVLTAPSRVQWQSAAASIASVDSTGLVTGVNGGVTQITVTETESGKSAAVLVTVPNGNANFTLR